MTPIWGTHWNNKPLEALIRGILAMAPSAADPLRRTLDTYSVPKDTADRPYLESVLRRLGYTEAEIRAYLGDEPAAPAPEPEMESSERVVEVEYTGPGLREFSLVQPVTQEEFDLAQRDSGPTIEMESGPSLEEVERALAEGNLADDFGDFEAEAPPEVPIAEDMPPMDSFDENAAPDLGEGENGENLSPAELIGDDLPADPLEDVSLGESLVEFSEAPLAEAEVEPVSVAEEAQRLRDEGWSVDEGDGVFTPDVEQEPEPATPDLEDTEVVLEPGEAFQYNDWALYRKDEAEGPNPQSIYFFSKSKPEGAEPSEVPEGYEVAENPETGRPFLRRKTDDAWGDPSSIEQATPGIQASYPAPRKRVRIVRVRAATREEALEKMRQEGRNVLASMPIDIEKRGGA